MNLLLRCQPLCLDYRIETEVLAEGLVETGVDGMDPLVRGSPKLLDRKENELLDGELLRRLIPAPCWLLLSCHVITSSLSPMSLPRLRAGQDEPSWLANQLFSYEDSRA